MNLVVQREYLAAFHADAAALLEKHRQEIAQFKEIPLDVDLERYQQQENAGILRIYAARLYRGAAQPRALIGYAVFYVAPSPHYKGSLQAAQDVLYIDPSQRKGATGIYLIRESERQLQAEGVQVIYHHVKDAHPQLGKLLTYFGYEAVETVYAKRVA